MTYIRHGVEKVFAEIRLRDLSAGGHQAALRLIEQLHAAVEDGALPERHGLHVVLTVAAVVGGGVAAGQQILKFILPLLPGQVRRQIRH